MKIMFSKPGQKYGSTFIAAVTVLLLLAGVLIGGLLKGQVPAVAASGVLTGEACNDYLQAHENLENAISKAILSRESGYSKGEFSSEGHIVLGIKESENTVKAYTLASFGYFGFENGIFTKTSGSGSIPTVIVLKPNGESGYSLADYKEPLDGSGYTGSIRKMFPEELWERVLKDNSGNSVIYTQQKSQAEAYLRSIGREAEVTADYVEKKLPDISTTASNKIFSEFMKYDPELNKFPYWIGTREELDSETRYIYKTSQDKAEDGSDLIIFTKTTGDGSTISETRYKITGDDVVKLP